MSAWSWLLSIYIKEVHTWLLLQIVCLCGIDLLHLLLIEENKLFISLDLIWFNHLRLIFGIVRFFVVQGSLKGVEGDLRSFRIKDYMKTIRGQPSQTRYSSLCIQVHYDLDLKRSLFLVYFLICLRSKKNLREAIPAGGLFPTTYWRLHWGLKFFISSSLS